MDRKEFLKKGLLGAAGTFLASCRPLMGKPWDGSGPCPISPEETEGPFPIHKPAELVKNSIAMDRKGVPMTITLTVKKQSDNCNPFPGVLVDVWHCDSDGNYSEYGGGGMQPTDYTEQHFLRGRQTTDANGQVSFISIFPGWYQNRAPHIHVEILDAGGTSLLVTQIAFSKESCDLVYATEHYRGPAEVTNERDDIFNDSLAGNMADSITGDTAKGYTLLKTINV